MRKTALIILFLSFCTVAYNQIIRGTIRDQSSDSTINFAAVYFNGTYVGTHSDREGRFSLDISKNSSMPLTISALGYYSVNINDFSSAGPYLIYLTPKIFELAEVIISANAKAIAKERRENMRIFKNEFLGTTLNALKCEITNEEDIKLVYNPITETLRAFSSKPLLIENRALGYDISYYIDKFEYCKADRSMLLVGNCIFVEDSATTKTKGRIYNNRRRTAYLGSRMHFFRALWEDKLDSSGFVVKNSKNKILDYNWYVYKTDSIITDASPKYLRYPEKIFVYYYSKELESVITFVEEQGRFYKDGFFNPLSISWWGEMAKQRVADMLPFEYSPK